MEDLHRDVEKPSAFLFLCLSRRQHKSPKMVMDQRNVANRVACCVRLIKDHFDVLPNTGVLVLNSFNLIKLQWAGNRWGYDVIIQMIECWPNLVQIGAHIHRGCL